VGGNEVGQLVVDEGPGGDVGQSVMEKLVAVRECVEQLCRGGVADGGHWGGVELVL
jgi:hypothetical protein